MDGAALTPCTHCGLPAPAGARFCCYGCELAARIRAEARDDHASLLGTLTFSAVLSMVVMMLALFLYAEDVFDASADVEMAWLRSIYRWASWALATPVMALSGCPLLGRAAASLRKGRMSMDALIAVSAFAAYGISVFDLLAGRPRVYFDSATAAVVLATLGRYLEATARSHASHSLGTLVEVSRGFVQVVGADGARRAISAAEVVRGMRLEIGAGQVVPVDMALDDDAEVDLAVLTGEARPVNLDRGATVPAGAVAVAAMLSGTALRESRDSTLERLSALARDLSEHRTGVLRWADRFAAALTPVVCLVAAGSLVYWTHAGSLEAGIVAALAVALAACPCSYAIASPLVCWLMMRRAFARRVVIRSADALEGLATTRVVAFDKTGTLTRPELRVIDEKRAPEIGSDEVRSLLCALEEGSSHPIARALLEHAGRATPVRLFDRRFLPGGVTAKDADGRQISLGAGNRERVELVRDGVVMASFDVSEELRPESAEVVRALGALGMRVVLLSGDDQARVDAIAAQLGGIEARARLGPEGKVAFLAALGDSTAMVGDGINDAPSLAGRMTSFTLGDSAPLARGLAQVMLVDGDLRLVPWTILLARRGIRLVRILIGASTAYNLVFVALAATGSLKPVWAGVSMLGSSLLSLFFAAGAGGGARSIEVLPEPPEPIVAQC